MIKALALLPVKSLINLKIKLDNVVYVYYFIFKPQQRRFTVMNIETNFTPAVIKTNFELAKQEITTDLEKYENYVVTNETLADDKKLAQSIKSKGTEINDLRLAKKKELIAPIDDFEKQANELKCLYFDAANKISEQVTKFEKVTLDKLRDELIELLKVDFEKLGVKEQFQIFDVNHLIKLTNITASNKPTKKAKDGVLAIGQYCFIEQSRYNDRIMQAENQSLRAGLASPLQEIHIKSFIFAGEDQFKSDLESLISVELERQQETQSKVQAQTPPATKTLDLPKSEVFEQIQGTQIKGEQLIGRASRETKITVVDGKIEYICTATFKVTVPEQVPVSKIEEKLVKMIEDSGITSLQCVEVKPNGI